MCVDTNNRNASVDSCIGKELYHFTHRNLDASFILLLIPGTELYLLILISLTFFCDAALPTKLCFPAEGRYVSRDVCSSEDKPSSSTD